MSIVHLKAMTKFKMYIKLIHCTWPEIERLGPSIHLFITGDDAVVAVVPETHTYIKEIRTFPFSALFFGPAALFRGFGILVKVADIIKNVREFL